MFKNIMFVISAVALITSCNTRQIEDVIDPTAEIDVAGVSVLPPKGNNWKIVNKSETNINFIRKGLQPDTTYAAIVVQLKLPDTESKEQFANEISEKLQSETESERFKLIKNEGQLFDGKGTNCWRYHMISEDRNARTDSGNKTMLLEMVGYICQHPKTKNKGINIIYSNRYYSGNQDLKIEAKADEFFNQVSFTDSKPVSGALQTNKEQAVTNEYFTASITTNCTHNCKSFVLTVENKANKDIELDWMKTDYIKNGLTHIDGFMFEGVEFKDRENKKPPEIIPAYSSFYKRIWPNTLVDSKYGFTNAWYESRKWGLIYYHKDIPPGLNGVSLSIKIGEKEVKEKILMNIH